MNVLPSLSVVHVKSIWYVSQVNKRFKSSTASFTSRTCVVFLLKSANKTESKLLFSMTLLISPTVSVSSSLSMAVLVLYGKFELINNVFEFVEFMRPCKILCTYDCHLGSLLEYH